MPIGFVETLGRLFGLRTRKGEIESFPTAADTAASAAMAFRPSYQPYKPERKNTPGVEKRQQEEWEEFGRELSLDTYPFGYGVERDATGLLTGRYREKFRSKGEVAWATAFDRMGMDWEYEPLKFDMGQTHHSYTPDFRVRNLGAPGSDRPLFIEVKQFPHEEMNLTKYVRFTEWYATDLLVVAHESSDTEKNGDLFRPKHQRYFLILRCTDCETYDWFPCDDYPTSEYIQHQNNPNSQYIRQQAGPYQFARSFPFGYILHPDGTYSMARDAPPPPFRVLPDSSWSPRAQEEYWNQHLHIWEANHRLMPCASHPPTCREKPMHSIIAPNYFLIQNGTIQTRPVVLTENTITWT